VGAGSGAGVAAGGGVGVAVAVGAGSAGGVRGGVGAALGGVIGAGLGGAGATTGSGGGTRAGAAAGRDSLDDEPRVATSANAPPATTMVATIAISGHRGRAGRGLAVCAAAPDSVVGCAEIGTAVGAGGTGVRNFGSTPPGGIVIAR